METPVGNKVTELAGQSRESLIKSSPYTQRVFGVPDHRVAQLFRSGEDAEDHRQQSGNRDNTKMRRE